MTFDRRSRHAAAAVLAALLLSAVPAAAQTVTGAELKAAYLYNFAQFVEWPPDVVPTAAPLALCVMNDSSVADALERTIKGRTVGGHSLTVKHLKTGVPLPTCHVLYLSDPDLQRSLDLIGTVKDPFVFTVSDVARFAQTGGMVELFVESGRMRFAVNVDAMQRARVRLSSRVLTLAKIVRDTPAR